MCATPRTAEYVLAQAAVGLGAVGAGATHLVQQATRGHPKGQAGQHRNRLHRPDPFPGRPNPILPLAPKRYPPVLPHDLLKLSGCAACSYAAGDAAAQLVPSPLVPCRHKGLLARRMPSAGRGLAVAGGVGCALRRLLRHEQYRLLRMVLMMTSAAVVGRAAGCRGQQLRHGRKGLVQA